MRDFDRGLNERGRRGAALIGAHINRHGIPWRKAIASPAERIRATLAASGLTLDVQWDERAYLADSAMLIEIVRGVEEEPETLLLCAHNPGLQELIFELVAPERGNALLEQVAAKYPTATFAVLELDIRRWADCAPGCGRLVHFARPRDLDPELGPERVR